MDVKPASKEVGSAKASSGRRFVHRPGTEIHSIYPLEEGRVHSQTSITVLHNDPNIIRREVNFQFRPLSNSKKLNGLVLVIRRRKCV